MEKRRRTGLLVSVEMTANSVRWRAVNYAPAFCCMRYKENVGLLDNQDFVCCFCIASKTLSLAKEVELLRSEVKELRQKLATHVAEEVTRQSDRLEDTAEDETKDHAREEMSYSAAVKRKKSSKKPSGNEKGNLETTSRDSRTTQKRPRVREQTHPKKMPPTHKEQPQAEKKFIGRRKLWGTKIVNTKEEIKAFLVSRVPEAESVNVKHVFKVRRAGIDGGFGSWEMNLC